MNIYKKAKDCAFNHYEYFKDDLFLKIFCSLTEYCFINMRPKIQNSYESCKQSCTSIYTWAYTHKNYFPLRTEFNVFVFVFLPHCGV